MIRKNLDNNKRKELKMKKNELIKKIEDAVTDMEYYHINPYYKLEQKWFTTFVLDIDRLNIKIKKDRETIHFNAYADEFEITIIYKGKEFKEKQEVEFQIFYNLDTDSVNIYTYFYYPQTREILEIIYDTAKQNVEDMVDDYYSKIATFLKNEETEKAE